MIRNVCRNTAIASEDNPSLATNISEYKIAHTTYIVETHFNLGCRDTLDDIIKHLCFEGHCNKGNQQNA